MTETRPKAIETAYKGYRFRSRLEARWAVFFDALGWSWTYEEEGFENEWGDKYLPDFVITHHGGDFFKKVVHKVFVEVKGNPKALIEDHERMVRLLDFGGVLPGFTDSHYQSTPQTGLLLLGEVPYARYDVVFHPLITHYKGLWKKWVAFNMFDRCSSLLWSPKGELAGLFDLESVSGLECDSSGWLVEFKQIKFPQYYPKINNAYTKARSARFEHGETP